MLRDRNKSSWSRWDIALSTLRLKITADHLSLFRNWHQACASVDKLVLALHEIDIRDRAYVFFNFFDAGPTSCGVATTSLLTKTSQSLAGKIFFSFLLEWTFAALPWPFIQSILNVNVKLPPKGFIAYSQQHIHPWIPHLHLYKFRTWPWVLIVLL